MAEQNAYLVIMDRGGLFAAHPDPHRGPAGASRQGAGEPVADRDLSGEVGTRQVGAMSSSFEAAVNEFMVTQNQINNARQRTVDAYQQRMDAQARTLAALTAHVELLSGRVDRLAEKLAAQEARRG